MTRFLLPALPILLFAFACSSSDPDSNIPAAADAPSEPSDESKTNAPPPTDEGNVDPPPPSGDAGSDASAAAPKNYAQGPSAGCAKTTGAKGLQTLTKTIAGKQREYLRFIPTGYTPGTKVSLVLGFHGSGGTAVKARSMFELEAKAGAKAIFIYPQGLPDPAFDGDNRWDPTAGSADYTFIDELIADAEASHCIDRDRIFAVGFSNGARMTSMLGCHRGNKLRAIAPVAPGGNDNTLPLATSACVGEVAIWEGLGTEDPDHLEGATLVRDWYRTANGCTATRKATTPAGCEAYDGCRTKVPSTWCSYPGGHSFPSFGATAVWTFFSGL